MNLDVFHLKGLPFSPNPSTNLGGRRKGPWLLRLSHLIISLVVAGTIMMSTLLGSPALADQQPLLKLGATGPQVTALQQALKDLGLLPGRKRLSNHFGPLTAGAVLAFKKGHGLGGGSALTLTILDEIKADARRTAKVSTPLGVRIAQKALTYLGTPYVWGGSSPSGFDCSGFTKYLFAKFGIDLPRTAAEQAQVGTPISENNLLPGDLVFFDTEGGISHVGIYIGGGKFVSEAGQNLRIDNIHNPYYWASRYVTARQVS